MFDHRTVLGAQQEHPVAEAADVLGLLVAQAQHWQASLLRTQSELQALSERSERPGCTSELVALACDEAVSLAVDLLAQGPRQVLHVRPADSPLLDCPKTREAIRANPQVRASELLSRPTAVPRAIPGQDRIAVKATWAELDEIAIIDDRVAFIPSVRADRATEIFLVQQPFVVRQLVQFFKAFWAQATGGQEPVPVQGGVDVELKHQIIMLLAQGAKDEAVARRLGISLRTCRRHVAEILGELDSSSRFQAGVRAALLGAVPPRQQAGPQWAS